MNYREIISNIELFCIGVKSTSVVQWLSCLPLNPRFAGSKPADDDGFLREIKSATCLPSEVK
jgi:hypothetical protein